MALPLLLTGVAQGRTAVSATPTLDGAFITGGVSAGRTVLHVDPTGALQLSGLVARGVTVARGQLTGHLMLTLDPCVGRTVISLHVAPDMSENDPVRIGVTLSGSYKAGEGVLAE